MSRAIPLDMASPMRSLREVAGKGNRGGLTAFAALREVAQSTQSNSEAAGDAVSVRVLREAAEAAGLVLVLSVRAKE